MAFDGANFELMPRELKLALVGELEKTLEGANHAVQVAADNAITDITNETKRRLRAMVTDAGLGKRLANSVRATIYDNAHEAAGAIARNPAGWIYVQDSAIHIFRAFEAPGATIRGKDGGPIAIPIPDSPADRKNFGQQLPGRTVIETMKARGVQLQYVPARGDRPAMLVAVSVRLSTRASGRTHVGRTLGQTKSGADKAGAASVPLFWLVPQAKMPAKLNWNREFLRVCDSFMQMFAEKFEREIEAWAQRRGN